MLSELENVPTKDEKPSGNEALVQPSSPESAAKDKPNDINSQKLTKVFVKKYGVSAWLPKDVFPDAEKLGNSDESFLQGKSWTGQTTVTFSSVREPLAKVYAECATEHSPQAPSKTVQYKVLKSTWFVVSGDLGPEADASLGFYTKGVQKGGSIVIMHFQWREDDFPFSQEIFTEMSRRFKPQILSQWEGDSGPWRGTLASSNTRGSARLTNSIWNLGAYGARTPSLFR